MDLSFLYVLGPMIIVFAAYLVWNQRRTKRVLQNWASQHGYRIVRTGGRSVFRSPVQYEPGARFSVELEDRQGRRRTGWMVWRNVIGRSSAADIWVIWDDGQRGP